MYQPLLFDVDFLDLCASCCDLLGAHRHPSRREPGRYVHPWPSECIELDQPTS